MYTADELESEIITMTQEQLITWCIDRQHIPREKLCHKCNSFLKLSLYCRNRDGFAWRCINNACGEYKKYFSLRKGTFFETFTISIKMILRIIVRYASRTPRYAIIDYFRQNKKTVLKVINTDIEKMPMPDFATNELGGYNKIVQIDETMLNYKCKSHRGRSPTNKTDAICIIEFGHKIVRVFAAVIPDKREATLIPIICNQVASGSIIWTNEHRSYFILHQYSYVHDTVCHKS